MTLVTGYRSSDDLTRLTSVHVVISAAWYDSPYMGVRPRTHWSGWSFIRSWSKPWRRRQGTWRAWVQGRFSRGHHARISPWSTMRLCIYENLHRDQRFDVTTPDGLRITPSDTAKIMERIAIRKIRESTLEKITLEQAEISLIPDKYLELFNRASISYTLFFFKNIFYKNIEAEIC